DDRTCAQRGLESERPLGLEQSQTQPFVTVFSRVTIAHRCEALEVAADRVDPHQRKLRRRRFDGDAKTSEADVFGERSLLFYALHRLGEVLDEHRLGFLLARGPSPVAARPLLGLKDVPRALEVSVGRMRSQKLYTDSRHVTLWSLNSSHQRIRHVRRILK